MSVDCRKATGPSAFINSLPTQYRRLLNYFVQQAAEDQNIRCLFVFGSRGRNSPPYADEYSDLDLAIVCREPALYTNNPNWVDCVKPVLFFHLQPTSIGRGMQVRIMFDGAYDADCVFIERSSFDVLKEGQIFRTEYLDRGIYTLIDKDGDLFFPQKSNEKTETEILWSNYENDVRDFLYHAVYAAKKIKRGELLTAKNTIDNNLRGFLVQLMRCETKATCFKKDTFHRARHFESWATDEYLSQIKKICTGFDGDEMKGSILEATKIAEQISRRLSALGKYKNYDESFSAVILWMQRVFYE